MAIASPLLSSLLHDSRSRPVWRVVLVASIAVVVWFAFGPPPPAPQMPDGDKINHMLAFLVLAAAASFSQAPGWRALALTFAGLLVFGAFIELVQTQLPHRHGDWGDLGADAMGAACGLLLAAALRRVAAVPASATTTKHGQDWLTF